MESRVMKSSVYISVATGLTCFLVLPFTYPLKEVGNPQVNPPQPAIQLTFRCQKPGTENQLVVERQTLADLLAEQAKLRKTRDIIALKKSQAALSSIYQAIATLYEPASLSGVNVQEAFSQPISERSSNWSVVVRFDPQGSSKFAELTKDLAGTRRTLGIFLNGNLISAPLINAQFAATGITGGAAEITGNFTAAEANRIALQLRAQAKRARTLTVEGRRTCFS